jgi:hypothetical protein
MTRFALHFIYARVTERPAGYVEQMLAAGRVVGDTIEFDDATYNALARKYQGSTVRWTLAQKVANFAATVGAWGAAGCPVVDQSTLEARATRCFSCPHWLAEAVFPRCEVCGCSELKQELKTAKCPIGRWP